MNFITQTILNGFSFTFHFILFSQDLCYLKFGFLKGKTKALDCMLVIDKFMELVIYNIFESMVLME